MHKNQQIINYFIENILNFIFPAKCGFCDAITEKGNFICTKCQANIKDYTNRCQYCGKTTYLQNKICIDCQNKKIYYDRLIFINEYDKEFKDKIIAYKFLDKKYLYNFFAEIMGPKLQNQEIDIITFVPISSNRMSERGYNQSELIARKLGKNLDIECKNLLYKTKDTKRQSELNKNERHKNVKNSFKLADNINIYDKKILLIDDVFTTGATVNECAKQIKKGAPASVLVATICIAHHL